MQLILIAVVTFALCFGVDKAFHALFRNKAQHKTGLAIHLPHRYGVAGIVLFILGLAGIFAGLNDRKILVVGGVIVMIVGAALVAYYLAFGIYYDEDTFLISGLGKKQRQYRFSDIESQQLYQSGGSIVVELFLKDGSGFTVQTAMDGAYPFLDHAFAAWCRQRGIDPNTCEFHDAANSLWFPTAQ